MPATANDRPTAGVSMRLTEVSNVRQPACRDGVAAARRGVHAAARRARLEHLGKVVAADAEEHARRAAQELGSPQPGRVERLVPPFEQQPLLRVHCARLRRRHAEAPVVKPLGAKQKRTVPCPPRHRLAAGVGGRRRLPPCRRHLADQVVPARRHAPHRRHTVGALRQQRARAGEHDLGQEERPCRGDKRRGGSRGGVLHLEEGGELPRRWIAEDQRARQCRRALAERLDRSRLLQLVAQLHTAPSESSPASSSGASASTGPPAVRAASASTVSSDTDTEGAVVEIVSM
eukprot:scaffold38754_cov66-Phaeocystis_antarctica.AAC.2